MAKIINNTLISAGKTEGVWKRGYSAYDIAKQNGFQGTEKQWLESLRGKSGEADSIALSDYDDNYEAMNVEDAFAEVCDKLADVLRDSAIILDHTADSLVYTLYQGVKDSAHKIGEISIPSDMVATSGSLYTATAQDTDLVEGDMYIKMTVANSGAFYIPVQNLIDVYVGAEVQTGIEINVRDGIISATIKTLDGTKLNEKSVKLESLEIPVQNALASAESAVQEIGEGGQDGTIEVDGVDVPVHGLGSAAYTSTTDYDASGAAQTAKAEVIGNSTDTDSAKTIEGVLKKINTVIGSLDSSATIASKSGDIVTLKAGIQQDNGVIDNNGNSDIVLSQVASTGNADDISIRDDGNLLAATNLENALQEIMSSVKTITDSLSWKNINS